MTFDPSSWLPDHCGASFVGGVVHSFRERDNIPVFHIIGISEEILFHFSCRMGVSSSDGTRIDAAKAVRLKSSIANLSSKGIS